MDNGTLQEGIFGHSRKELYYSYWNNKSDDMPADMLNHFDPVTDLSQDTSIRNKYRQFKVIFGINHYIGTGTGTDWRLFPNSFSVCISVPLHVVG